MTSPPAASSSHRTSQGVAVGAAFLTLFSVVGCALYGLPFFYDFFVHDLGWTRQQVTSGNALSKLVVGPLFGFFAGWMVDKLGPRRLLLFGVVIAGGAVFGLSTVTGLGAFYFFYFLNALGYVFGGPLPNQVLLSRWFSGARGKAMGIAYLGIGVGGALVPLIALALIHSFGWRGALQGLGLLMVVIALPAAFVVREPLPSATLAAESGEAVRLGPILRQPAFYLLALGSMASIGAVGGMVQNLKLYLSLDRHLPQGESAAIASFVLWGSIAGRLTVGWLADRWPKKRVTLIVYAVVAATIPLIALAPTSFALKVAAFLFGIGLGGDYMMIPLIAAELFGVRAIGRVLGVVLTADGVAEAGFPLIVATLRDRTGSYEAGFWLLVALAVAGALAVSRLPSTPSRPTQPA